MKALTIHQPYAHLIAMGEKVVENRTYRVAYRGQLAIHAGMSKLWLTDGDETQYPDMAFGAIVAVATLSQCLLLNNLPPDLRYHPHAHGPWCWVLSDVFRIEPVNARGQQGLWTLDTATEREVRSRLAVVQSTLGERP